MGWNHQVFVTLFSLPQKNVRSHVVPQPGLQEVSRSLDPIRLNGSIPNRPHPAMNTCKMLYLMKKNILEIFLDSKKYNSFEHLLR